MNPLLLSLAKLALALFIILTLFVLFVSAVALSIWLFIKAYRAWRSRVR